MHVVIFTGGVLRDGKFLQDALETADLIIAADSGAKTALDFQVFPKVIIGDLDSLDADAEHLLREKGSEFIVCSPEKDETDTELALHYALEKQASKITILGGIEGDRIDHIFANVFLLIDMPVPLRYISGSTAVWVEKGPQTVQVFGQPNDLLSLIPLTAKVSGIKTDGLQYSLNHEVLIVGKTRGISNILTTNQATIAFEQGTLLFVHRTD